jgi:lipopolysaccharide biosynthesis glycosyltransferase
MNPPIVLACDVAYSMPLATTLRSIVESNRNCWPLEFHVLSAGFSNVIQGKVFDSLPKGSASVRWVEVDLKLFREFSTISYISKMTYARFLIPWVFPETISRVLFLDADLLVLDDLEKLVGEDLEGAIVGAVLDLGIDQKIKDNNPRVSNVPRVRDYFNAGVLLIDLDRWRSEKISERAIEYLSRHPQSPFSDQDALNVACDGRWKKLDARWNAQDHANKEFSTMNREQLPGIIHFVTSLKPWDARSLSLNARFYDAFRNRTCFARTSRDIVKDCIWHAWCRSKSIVRQSLYSIGT